MSSIKVLVHIQFNQNGSKNLCSQQLPEKPSLKIQQSEAQKIHSLKHFLSQNHLPAYHEKLFGY